ncbi:MAG: MFS transporter [Proteobacteria bacterium]|nr:MFS transporter [Pseudomonadota bacterium]
MPARIPLAFFTVSLANFLSFLNFAFFFLLPVWVLKQGGGEEAAGRIIGVAGLAGLIVLPAVGYLLDRMGRRRFLIFGTAIGALTSLAFIGVNGIGWQVYALRALQGVAFTCSFTGAQTLAVLFAPASRRAEVLGWFGISTILTHAISPALGEEIVRRFSFDHMFACGAVVGVAAFLVSCLLPRPPELHAHPDDTPADRGMARRAVVAACLAMLCYGFGFGSVQTFVPAMITRLDLGRVGVFFTCWSIAAVATRIFLGRASDRFGRRAVLVPAMATMSLAVAMLAFAHDLPMVLAAGVVFGLAQGLLYPTMNALVVDWSHPENIGRTQSLFSGSYSLGISACSFLFGTIVENHGYAAMYVASLAVTSIGLLFFVLRGPSDRAPAWPGAQADISSEEK